MTAAHKQPAGKASGVRSASRIQAGRLSRALRALASIRVTLAALAMAGAIALLGEGGRLPVGLFIAAPFGLLFLNLLAALACKPALQSQKGLLVFHLALALLALLIAGDRLTAFYGHTEITEGTAFDPRLVNGDGGPWHDRAFTSIAFVQGDFDIDYAPGMKRRGTRSRVLIPDGKAGWRQETVGDDKPLVLAGYRFYTTFNKGFSPVLEFTGDSGVPQLGAIHLPSYPLNHFKQGNDWQIPGSGRSLKVWLHIPEEVYRVDDAWAFALPENPRLVVIDGEERRELSLGEAVSLPEGRLRFQELRKWMGYSISYNPLMPWIIAAICLAIAALGWHGIAKMRLRPWDAPEWEEPEQNMPQDVTLKSVRDETRGMGRLSDRPNHAG